MTILDTNVLIYHADGKLENRLAGSDYGISILSEIEVLGYGGLSADAEVALKSLISTVLVVPIDEAVKDEAIRLRRATSLRLPDAIIAATAIARNADLLTLDVGLLKISGLTATAPTLKP